MEKTIVYIKEEQISQLFLDKNFLRELLEKIEKGLGNFSAGEERGGFVQPLRHVLSIKHGPRAQQVWGSGDAVNAEATADGRMLVMPCFVCSQRCSQRQDASKDPDICALATKVMTFFPGGKNNGEASRHAYILLLDSANGSLKALMDGEVITYKRTAAASAVATKYLAPKNSKVLCIMGAGHLARPHLEALRQVCDFTEVRVWSRNFATAKKFADEYADDVKACQLPEEAVRGADVIVTVTRAISPVVQAEWVKPGAHINCVGAIRPSTQELDPEIMRNSIVFVDSRTAAEKESGDVILSGATIEGEVGELVLGVKDVPKDKTTVFKSMVIVSGLAIEDVISAKLVYDKFNEKINTEF